MKFFDPRKFSLLPKHALYYTPGKIISIHNSFPSRVSPTMNQECMLITRQVIPCDYKTTFPRQNKTSLLLFHPACARVNPKDIPRPLRNTASSQNSVASARAPYFNKDRATPAPHRGASKNTRRRVTTGNAAWLAAVIRYTAGPSLARARWKKKKKGGADFVSRKGCENWTDLRG